MNTLAKRLKYALDIRGMKQSDLCKATGIGKSSISTYLSGAYIPKQTNIYKIAKALNIDEAWLMGLDVPMERQPNNPFNKYDNIRPIETRKIPMIGEIACGKPVYCNQDYETFVEASSSIHADCCLTAKGDSMINARIFDGDIVFIHLQPDVENGEIAAVVIDDAATLKRVYKYQNRIELRPENPTYEVLNFEGDELNNVRILGKAVAFTSYIK